MSKRSSFVLAISAIVPLLVQPVLAQEIKALPLREDCTTRRSISVDPTPGLTLHVSKSGDDSGTGTEGKPFASLERARDAIRALKGAVPVGGVRVVIHGGEYQVSRTFSLSEVDSGNLNAPVVYAAAKGEKVTFRGGIRLADWKLLQGGNFYPLLTQSVIGKVWYVDLRELGLTNLIPLKLGGFASGNGFITHPAYELFFNGKAMQLARGPNKGFLHIAQVTVPDDTKGYDRKGSMTGIFKVKEPIPSKWASEPDLLLYGYWFWDWADSYERVASIDCAKGEITLAKPWHRYGYANGAHFYAYNALSELDLPGEWYLDRTNGRVILYPPSEIKNAEIELSTFAAPMLDMDNVSNVRFEGVTWELGSADAIHIHGGTNCLFAGCAIRRFAGNGVVMDGGTKHGLLSCDIDSMGRGGVLLTGGNRKTLVAGGHFIENCDIHDLSRIDHTYTPAILINGVGNQIRHNRLHDIQSSAIRVEGNNHLIEYNEVFNVVTESDDQGGIDIFGNPTFRGNVFRYNYWHHIGAWHENDEQPACGQCAIRLDDAISGTLIKGNIMERCSAEKQGFGGVQIHGGKDNWVEGNLFVNCWAAVSCSVWSEERWRNFVKPALDAQAIDRELYLKTYPELATLLENNGLNHVRSNIVFQCKQLTIRAPRNLDVTNNLQMTNGVFAPDPANPLFHQAGFERIPIAEMGLYADQWRRAH